MRLIFFKNKSCKGFTFIELLMVIIIISLLAAISLPLYINLQERATEASEEAIIGALTTAIKTKYLENIANGMTPTAAWPCQDGTSPFTLMENPPPYIHQVWPDSSDNNNWHTYYGVRQQLFFTSIFCPHWVPGSSWPSGIKGCQYMYNVAPGPSQQLYGHQQGDLWLITDAGH